MLDSGFCVLRGLIELKKRGVYASEVIKKRRYWPKYIKGDVIDVHMKDKFPGDTDAMTGNLDGLKFHVFNMKETEFNMKMMTMYGDLDVPDGQETTRRYFKGGDGIQQKSEFKYTIIFSNHFLFRHTIDNHNNLWHYSPSAEETWVTQRWPVRIFTFLLSITEVNSYLAFKYFVWGKTIPTLHQFHRKHALEIIMNEYIGNEEALSPKRKRKVQNSHDLTVEPKHAKKEYQ